MKQTAVEYLIEQIKKDSNLRLRGFDIDGIGNQAKEIEKQQIIDAYDKGNRYMFEQSGEKYYNETFNK
jgi:hypothetical protein